MEIIAILAVLVLIWLFWQLVQAKRFTRFKQLISDELKDKVIADIKQELEDTRCDEYPNNNSHEEATIFYWTQYKSRILHAALAREIVDHQWLVNTNNLKNAQHLFFVERHYLPQPEKAET